MGLTKLELALIASLMISIVLNFVFYYLLRQANKLTNEYYVKYRTEQRACMKSEIKNREEIK